MRPLQVVGVIVTMPQVLRLKVSDEQTFAMMPAVTKDIVILLAFGCLFIFA